MPRKSKEKIYVLDAWAILAFLQAEEPAASMTLEILDQGESKTLELHMSLINLGEVFYIIGKQRSIPEARETLEEILLLPVKLHEANREQILAAAEIKAKASLSYADAFAAALTQKLGATLLTGNPEILRMASSDLKVKDLTRQR